MSNQIDTLWASAKAVKLTSDERASVRQSLVEHIALGHGAMADAALHVSLSSQETSDMRQELESFMRSHPVRRSFSVFSPGSYIPSFRFASLAFAVVLLITSSGGAVAYASENALPGDSLYTVKTDIVEPLRERMAFGDKAKARWHLKRTQRRLHEAKTLMNRGDFTSAKQALIQQRLEHHIEKLQNRLDSLSGQPEADAIRSALEAELETHESFLQQVGTGSVTREDMQDFRDAVKRHKRAIQHHRPRARRPGRQQGIRSHRQNLQSVRL